MPADRISVVIIAPDPDRVKGGMSTWVRNILASELTREYPLEFIATYVEDRPLIKFGVVLRAFFIFLYKLATLNFDLAHIHVSQKGSFYRKLIFILLAKAGRKKVLLHCHGSRFDQFYQKGPSWQKALIRWGLSLCDGVVTLSPQWNEFYSQIMEPGRLRILENAIPLQNYQRPPGHEKSLSKNLVVLFAGEVGERKGAYDLLAIVPDLIGQVPQARVLLAGNGDPIRIGTAIQSFQIEDRLQWLGWVSPEEMIGIYHQADIFVLPSYHEGLPMAILEAMACGLPIVSTKVGGIPELIEEGENGILIHPGDRVALLNSLASLLNDPILREHMALKNVQKIREQYDIPIYIQKLKNLYGDILGVKP